MRQTSAGQEARPETAEAWPEPAAGAGAAAGPGRPIAAAATSWATSATAAGLPRPRRRLPWIAVAILVAVAFLGSFGLRVWLKGAHQSQTRTQVLSHPITAIQVDAPGGPSGSAAMRSAR